MSDENALHFTATDLPQVVANDKQEWAVFVLAGDDGRELHLRMQRGFAAHFVRQCNTQFKAIETRAKINQGTTYEQRRAWPLQSSRFLASATAEAQEHKVLVVLDRASPYETTYHMTPAAALDLAEELQKSANQALKGRKDQT